MACVGWSPKSSRHDWLTSAERWGSQSKRHWSLWFRVQHWQLPKIIHMVLFDHTDFYYTIKARKKSIPCESYLVETYVLHGLPGKLEAEHALSHNREQPRRPLPPPPDWLVQQQNEASSNFGLAMVFEVNGIKAQDGFVVIVLVSSCVNKSANINVYGYEFVNHPCYNTI